MLASNTGRRLLQQPLQRHNWIRSVGSVLVRKQTRSSVSDAPGSAAAKVFVSHSIPTTAGFGRRVWRAYTRRLEKSPLWTKATMAAVIFFVSDSATQLLLPQPFDPTSSSSGTESATSWKASRALSGAGFGVIATTWLHYWWGFLEMAVGTRLPVARHRFANTITKVVLDQGIGAPCYIYSYYVLTNFLQRLHPQATWNELHTAWTETSQKASDMLWPTMFQHWRLWPAVHTLNFYYTPLHHRVLVQNTVLIGWSAYLSHLNFNDTNKLMTPNEEINVSIARRETARALAKIETQRLQHPQTDIHSSLDEAGSLDDAVVSPKRTRMSLGTQ